MMTASPRTGSNDSSLCATVEELLPWYVNETLDAAQRRLVDTHVAGCANCRAALALEHRMAESMRTPQDNVEVSPHAAWQKLQAQLDAEPRTVAKQSRKFLRSGFWPVATNVALVAQAAAIAVLGFALYRVYERPAPLYQTLLTADETLRLNGALVRIAFDSKMDAETVLALAERVNGRIVGGPTANNVYTLAFATQQVAQTPEADVQDQIDWLRTQPHVVLVEPVALETH